jgi:hypothetical protein
VSSVFIYQKFQRRMIKMKNNDKVQLALQVVATPGMGQDAVNAARKIIHDTLNPPTETCGEKQLRPTQEQVDRLYNAFEEFNKEYRTNMKVIEGELVDKISKGSYYGAYGEPLEISTTRIYHNGESLKSYLREYDGLQQRSVNNKLRSDITFCKGMIAILTSGALVLVIDRIVNM